MSEEKVTQGAEEKITKAEATVSAGTEEIGGSAEGLADKAGEVWDTVKEKTSQTWDKVEDKAEELWDKAKSGELTTEAKEKLGQLAGEAKELWNKLVDKFDGDNEDEKKL